MTNKTKEIIIKNTNLLCRMVVGCLFIFSGFVKAVDPWGTIYKINDYLNVLQLALPYNVVLVSTFILFSIEFIIGVFLFLGSYKKIALTGASLLMLVMLPLSLWIVIANPVEDCGCFGDALIISNNTTFLKNVIISVMLLWLIKYKKRSHRLVARPIQWIGFVFSAVFIVLIGLIGYIYQPLIDFRPYPIDSELISHNEITSDASDFVFIYEKDGSQHTFKLDEIPDEDLGWQFIERKEINHKNNVPINDDDKIVTIYDENDNDVTQDVVDFDNEQIILFIPSLSDFSIASTYQINSLYTYCQKYGIDMFAVVAGSIDELNEFKDLSIPEYPIYISEDTSIKEIVRGCPAIIYLDKGIIKWKSSLRAINIDDFLRPSISSNPMDLAYDNKLILKTLCSIWLIAMMTIILISQTATTIRFIKRQRTKNIEKNNNGNNNKL